MSNHSKIGAHVSIAGGLYKSIERAGEIGAETIQIFGASPRQWNVKIPPEQDIKKFKEYFEKSKINSVFLHASYLVNIASPDDVIREKSIKNLGEHLKIAELLGAEGLIFHIGTRKDLDINIALKKCAEAIKIIFKKNPGKAKLIIENNAGEGKKVGTTPKEIGEIIKQVNSDRLAICIDTAHSFESGIIDKYTQSNIKRFFDEWEKEAGRNKIIVLHLNDSKTPANSRRDRHENIGEGYIGLSGFKNLAKEKRVNKLPWILETPGFNGEGPDKKNIKILKSCFKGLSPNTVLS